MDIYKREKSNMLEWFLPFFPVLHQYQISFLSLGIIGLMIIAIVVLLEQGWKVSFPKQWRGFFVFFAYIVVRDILRLFLGHDVLSSQVNRIIEYVFVAAIVFIAATKAINFERLYKWFKIAGVIYIAGMIYHAVQITVFHRKVHWITLIPGYVLRGDTTVDLNRPTSFFAEPAGIVLGLIFFLIISLQKKEYKWAVLVSFGMVISTSTVAVIITALAWILAVLSKNMSVKKKTGMLVMFGLMIFLFFNWNIFDNTVTKLMAVLGGGSTVGSRLVGGFEVVSTLSPYELIFGSNYNDIRTYMLERKALFSPSSIAVLYYEAQGEVFLNTLASLFMHYGAIGVVLFYIPMARLLKSNMGKMTVICFVVLSVGQTLCLNAPYFMWLCIMLIILKNETSEDSIVKELTGVV